jgi:DNA-binding MarR family transcriptional regulator
MNEWPPGALSFHVVGALHAVEAQLEAALEPLGLSLAKLGALAKLVAAGEPLSLGALAERCACVRSNITQLVDRLEADKLVVRVDDPRDRRSVRAELTPEGRGRHAAGMRALEEAERAVLSRIPERDRDVFLQLLQSFSGVIAHR